MVVAMSGGVWAVAHVSPLVYARLWYLLFTSSANRKSSWGSVSELAALLLSS